MNKNLHLETLCKQVEDYGKTSFELCKSNAIRRFSDIFSSFLVYIILFTITLFSILFASIALAFKLGNDFGKLYYGFIIVALLFAAVSFLMYIFRNRLIKKPLENSLIRLSQQ